MAGTIPRMVNVVNRTCAPLDAMFDGQPVVLKPGYKWEDDGKGKRAVIGAGLGGAVEVNALPYFAGEMVKRQNPVMGTEDPESPADFESLVGVVEWGDDTSHLEQSDAEERLDREMLDEQAQTAKPIRKMKKGKRRGGRKYTDNNLKNPGGIKGEYAS